MVPVHTSTTNEGTRMTIMYMPGFDGLKDAWIEHENCRIIEMEEPQRKLKNNGKRRKTKLE